MPDTDADDIETHRELLRSITGGKVPALEGEDPGKLLKELAQYERFVQLRRDAPIRKRWFLDLFMRAQAFPHGDEDAVRANKSPPIRRNTFKYLVRPAEADFNLVLFLLLALNAVTLIVAFYGQVSTIPNMCGGPYMCPEKNWQNRPVIAPPLQFRASGTSDFRATDRGDFNGGYSTSCTYGSSLCNTPGYLVEWPYLQSAEGPVVFPEALKTACVQKTGKYVYDFDAGIIRNETWECEGDTIPFLEGGTPFHFNTEWYEKAILVTDSCLTSAPSGASYEIESKALDKLSTIDLAKMELCFLNHKLWRENGPGLKCHCTPTKVTWPLTEDSDYQSLNRHNFYGCFFGSAAASAPLDQDFFSCQAAPGVSSLSDRNTFRGTDAAEELVIGKYSAAQGREEVVARGWQVTYSPSKKAVLVGLLVAKELGPLTAVFICIALAILYFAFIVPMISILVQVYAHLALLPYQRTHFKNSLWMQAEEVFSELVNTIFSFCCGISSLYMSVSIVRRLCAALLTGQVNNAMVRDGRKLITAIGNILINYSVLSLGEARWSNEPTLFAGVLLSVTSAALQLTKLQSKQNFITAFLQDLNENRLSKFELALGLVKTMEDFLEDDVQFNFAQNLYGSVRVRPAALDEFEANPDAFNTRMNSYDEEQEREVNNGDWRSLLCCGDVQNRENPTIFNFYPLLPRALVDKFGHDGRYEYQHGTNDPPSQIAAVLAETHKNSAPQLSSIVGSFVTPTGGPAMMGPGPMLPNLPFDHTIISVV